MCLRTVPHQIRGKHPEVAGLSFLKDTSSVKSLALPFVCEPGTSFRYSIGLDWAGLVVERVSGQRLEEYFQEHIFKPCGITTMTFYPSTKLSRDQDGMCYRKPDGGIMGVSRRLVAQRPREESVIRKVELLAGGAGLFGTQKDYLAFLRGSFAATRKSLATDSFPPRGSQSSSRPACPQAKAARAMKPCSSSSMRGGTGRPTSPARRTSITRLAELLNLRCSANHRKLKSLAWSGERSLSISRHECGLTPARALRRPSSG